MSRHISNVCFVEDFFSNALTRQAAFRPLMGRKDLPLAGQVLEVNMGRKRDWGQGSVDDLFASG